MSLKASAITRDRYLTGTELVRLYLWILAHEHIDSCDPCFLVRFVLGSGLRVSEVPVLRVPEDCGHDGMIHVRRSKSGFGRMVKLFPELMPYYLERLATVTGPGLLFSREMVNGRAYSEPFTTKTLGRWWKDVLTAAGIRVIPIHGGRHTYATHELGSRRLQPFEVQMQLGHASVDMTLAFYTHALQEYMYETGVPEWRSAALGDPTPGSTRRILRAV